MTRCSSRRRTLPRQPRHGRSRILHGPSTALVYATWNAEENGEGADNGGPARRGHSIGAIRDARFSNRLAGATSGVERWCVPIRIVAPPLLTRRRSSPSSVCRRRAGARLATTLHPVYPSHRQSTRTSRTRFLSPGSRAELAGHSRRPGGREAGRACLRAFQRALAEPVGDGLADTFSTYLLE